jgi:hypothetical protein
MREAITKLLLFLTPFILVAFFIFLVDPYNLFNISHLFTDDVKIKCLNRTDETTTRGNLLWKTIEFERNPVPNILIGNSRTALATDSCLEAKLGGEATNLAFPGANLRTIIDMFWMAANSTELDNVILQVDFNIYNALRNPDLYESTRQIITKRFQYFFDWNILKDALSVCYYSFSKNEGHVLRSYKDRTDNWALTTSFLKNKFSLYTYPEELHKKLFEISEYCKSENINLIFLIAPNYQEVFTYVISSNLEDENNRFKDDLTKLGTTIDLDNEQPISLKRDNYFDHFHLKSQFVDSIISEAIDTYLIEKSAQ